MAKIIKQIIKINNLMIENSELHGKIFQIKDELDFINDNLTNVDMWKWNALTLEDRRSRLNERYDNTKKRINEISIEMKELNSKNKTKATPLE